MDALPPELEELLDELELLEEEDEVLEEEVLEEELDELLLDELLLEELLDELLVPVPLPQTAPVTGGTSAVPPGDVP